jgi:hypothetical protein
LRPVCAANKDTLGAQIAPVAVAPANLTNWRLVSDECAARLREWFFCLDMIGPLQ